ncbi:hypothetical protein NMU03_17155 [Allocoprobacillus halotolerans]|uniref:Uncharacterized protein n=1 Tax=Allocoprobacillus halotolerans TaxID=2944914 RepID=A0ABY5I1Q3_9FIRM|nr:hypothetical protein [Allocoprobacillus halotolerans]UTY39246.1 hypothetical protein NMU03_17155 [Allocoprobacillus halotolerans]
MSIEEELAIYLNKPGFQMFIDAWIFQYKRLGRLGGKIVLDNLDEDQKDCLSGLGLDLSNNKLELTYSQFQKS